jgi:hypothetical protein
MGLQGSYTAYTEGAERAKYNRDHFPEKNALAILDTHEVDLMPGEDENSVRIELAEDEKITGIGHEASVTVREVIVEEKRLQPPLEEHPVGRKSMEKLEVFHGDLKRLKVFEMAMNAHDHFYGLDTMRSFQAPGESHVQSRLKV